MNEIAGKVVVITGASSGIGASTATLLASRGAKLVLGARRTEQLEEIAQSIAGQDGEAASAHVDVAKRGDLDSLVQLAMERFGRVDALVQSAGIGPISPLDDLRVEEWESTVDVNIKGLLYAIAASLPIFRKQGFGHFLNISSTADRKTVPGQTVYSATKTAARVICDGLRQEAGGKLRVTNISPGFVKTEFIQAIADQTTREQYLAMRDKIAIAPEAIARAVVYAMEQPSDVDVNEIVIRPTAQG